GSSTGDSEPTAEGTIVFRGPDDRGDELRGALARLKGPARCCPLVELAQWHADRYWRSGPGTPAALPDLDAAIGAMREAHGYLGAADGNRGQVGSGLGMLLAARHLVHDGPETDRDSAIDLLEESLRAPALKPVAAANARLQLGQLLLHGAMRAVHAMGTGLTALRTGPPPQAKVDAAHAVEVLRAVVDGPALSAELTAAGESLLAAAEAVHDLLGQLGGGLTGGPAEVNAWMGRVFATMQATMQAMQEQMSRLGQVFGGANMSVMVFSESGIDPLDHPVMVVRG